MTVAHFFRQEELPGYRCARAPWLRGRAGALRAATGEMTAAAKRIRGHIRVATGRVCLSSGVRAW